MKLFLGTFLFFLWVLTTLATPRDIYFSLATNTPAGNDSTGTGSIGAPYLTFGKAKSVAVCGDTIIARGGTYTYKWTLASTDPLCGSFTTPITVKNYQSEHVIVLPNGGDAYALTSDSSAFYWKIVANAVDGITFDCTHCQYQNNGTASLGGSYLWLENVQVTNAWTDGIGAHTLTYSTFKNLHVDHNGVTTSTPGSNGVQNHGVYMAGHDNLIDGGTFEHNAYCGIQSYELGRDDVNNNVVRNANVTANGDAIDGGCGIEMGNGAGNLAYNDLITYNLGGPGLQFDFRCGLYGAACAGYNNTLFNNSVTLCPNTPDTCTGVIVRGNIVYGGGAAIVSSEATAVIDHNLTASNPLFTNSGTGDFTLQAMSPALGCGVNVQPLGIAGLLMDIIGVLRPNAAADCGAYSTPMANPGTGRDRSRAHR